MRNDEIFIHDGWQVVMAFKNGEVQDRYLWGVKQDELLCKNNEWTLGDHLNTVRDVIKSDGSVAKHLEYNAFGELQGEPADELTFAYTGKLFDAKTQLQWNINRWYDPKVGMWCSEDPIGFEGKDRNLYRYVGNAATRLRDALGLDSEQMSGETKSSCTFVREDVVVTDNGQVVDRIDYVYTYSITVPYEKKCSGSKNENAVVTIKDASGNMLGTLDQYGLSVLVLGATVSYHHKTEASNFDGPDCGKGYRGNVRGIKARYDVYERVSVGFNPGLGPFSFDFGWSIGVDTYFCSIDIEIQKSCCKECGKN